MKEVPAGEGGNGTQTLLLRCTKMRKEGNSPSFFEESPSASYFAIRALYDCQPPPKAL